jgi:hypothetical protein
MFVLEHIIYVYIYTYILESDHLESGNIIIDMTMVLAI